MRDQNYRNKNDERWNNRGYDKHSHHNDSTRKWIPKSINFCQYCGERLGIPDDSLNIQRQYQSKSEQLYRNTYQKGPSCGSAFVSFVIVIVFILMIVSFSVNGNVSASSNVPLDASMAVGYEDNVATSSISDTDYQVNESVTLSKNNFQEANQIFQSTPKKYVVKHGDTVYRIAVNMLGDGSRWIEIAQLNKLEQLSNGSILIHPGQELIIPD